MYVCLCQAFKKSFHLTSEGPNSKGEKITAKAHQGPIEIEGITVAHVDEQVRLQKVETWFDPLEMFRQIAPNGIVNKQARTSSDDHDDDHDEHDDHEHEHHEETLGAAKEEEVKNAPEGSKEEKSEATNTNQEESEPKQGEIEEPNNKADDKEKEEEVVNKLTKDFEQKSTLLEESPSAPTPSPAQPAAVAAAAPNPAPSADPDSTRSSEPPAHPPGGDAVAAPPSSEEIQHVHEEMSRITRRECPFLNQE